MSHLIPNTIEGLSGAGDCPEDKYKAIGLRKGAQYRSRMSVHVIQTRTNLSVQHPGQWLAFNITIPTTTLS